MGWNINFKSAAKYAREKGDFALQKATELKQRIEEAIAAGTEDLEVKDARGGHVNLRSRLDETNTLLAKTVHQVGISIGNRLVPEIDDSGRLQRAVDEAIANGGGVIRLTADEFVFGTTIQYGVSAIRWIGQSGGSEKGKTTTLKYTGTEKAFSVTSTGGIHELSFENLALVGTNKQGTGVYVDNAIVDFKNCLVMEFENGLELYNAWLGSVLNCTIRDNVNGIKFLYGANGYEVSGTRFNKNDKAINVQGFAAGLRIEGNSFEYNADSFYLGDTSLTKLTFSDNYFERNQSCFKQVGSTNQGIYGGIIEKCFMQQTGVTSKIIVDIENCNGLVIQDNNMFTSSGKYEMPEVIFGNNAKKIMFKRNYREKPGDKVLYQGGEVISYENFSELYLTGKQDKPSNGFNLVENPSFESDLIGWTENGSVVATISQTDGVTHGSKSVLLNANGFGGSLYSSASLIQSINSIQGAKILDYIRGRYVVLKADVKLLTSTKASLRIDDNSSSTIQEILYDGTFYVIKKISKTAPSLRISLYPDITTGGSGTAVFDNVSLNIGTIYDDSGDVINYIKQIDDSGNTRPLNVKVGYRFLDLALGKPIWWNGSSWVDAMGTVV